MHHRPLPFISGNMGRPVFSRITSLCVTIHDPDIRSVPKYPTSEGVFRLEIRSIFNIYWSNIARRLGACGEADTLRAWSLAGGTRKPSGQGKESGVGIVSLLTVPEKSRTLCHVCARTTTQNKTRTVRRCILLSLYSFLFVVLYSTHSQFSSSTPRPRHFGIPAQSI
jgi:hypothetical protein